MNLILLKSSKGVKPKSIKQSDISSYTMIHVILGHLGPLFTNSDVMKVSGKGLGFVLFLMQLSTVFQLYHCDPG